MSREYTWTNEDGLAVGFGKHTPDNEVAAVAAGSLKKTMRMVITLADLEDTDIITAASFSQHAARIRRGSIVTNAYVNTVIAAAGSSSTLDIGMYDVDTSSITVDLAAGLAADITEAEMSAVGEVHSLDGVYVANAASHTATTAISVGRTSTSDCVVICGFETAAFTAGVIELTIEYLEPQGQAIAAV